MSQFFDDECGESSTGKRQRSWLSDDDSDGETCYSWGLSQEENEEEESDIGMYLRCDSSGNGGGGGAGVENVEPTPGGSPVRTGTGGVDEVEVPTGGGGGTGKGAAKNWIFTCNNFTEGDLGALRTIECAYLRCQEEIGESGTRHLQGVLCLKDRKRRTQLTKLLSPRFHLEVMRGTIEQADNYAGKRETKVEGGVELLRGTRPSGAGHRSDLAMVAQEIRAGGREAQILDQHPSSYIRYHGGIRRAIFVCSARRNHKTDVFWYYGRTGTGKSRRAAELAPGAYWKDNGTAWWDGYEGHEDVIIDDYRCNMCTFNYLLRLFDRYPMQVQVKGGYVQFVAKRIIVTCNKSPREAWATRTDEDLCQLLRRITAIEEFVDIL